MNCIYLSTSVCQAQPIPFKARTMFYTPTEEEQKEFCKNKENFQECPRYVAYQQHLKIIGK